ncbi:MAG: ABC transporter ATP-binding protein [Phycisphaerae bacterium]
MGDTVVHALDGVDLEIDTGEFVAVTGVSGSGKSTLMHLFGGLDRPTAGLLEFQGQSVGAMNERKLAEMRNRHIGFVFQTFNLINRTSALDNVCVPLMYTRRPYSRKKALAALQRVGLEQRARHSPAEMSGGECQRVAIARAIVNEPALILADEPTGNLDTKTSGQIMGIFHELHDAGITIVVVTHEMEVAVQADRIVRMRDGRIVEDAAVDSTRREAVEEQTRLSHRRVERDRGAVPAATVANPGPRLKKLG